MIKTVNLSLETKSRKYNEKLVDKVDKKLTRLGLDQTYDQLESGMRLVEYNADAMTISWSALQKMLKNIASFKTKLFESSSDDFEDYQYSREYLEVEL